MPGCPCSCLETAQAAKSFKKDDDEDKDKEEKDKEKKKKEKKEREKKDKKTGKQSL